MDAPDSADRGDATEHDDDAATGDGVDGADREAGTVGSVDADAGGADATVAKVYYDEGEPVVLAAAFVIEDWPWVVGFDQTGTEGYDYVSIPSERVVAVMSPRYSGFSHNGRRVTAYGVMDEEVREFRDLLPL